MANGTSKILGLVNFSCDLEVSSIVHLFRSRSVTCLVSVSDFQTTVSVSRILPFVTPKCCQIGNTGAPDNFQSTGVRRFFLTQQLSVGSES